MFLKGAFKDSSVFVQLLMFIVVTIAGFAATNFLSSILIMMKFGVSLKVLQDVMQNLVNYPGLMRELQFLQVLGMFIFPAIICARLFSDNYKDYLQIETPICFPVMGLTVLSVLVAVPFLNLTYHINQQMVFPEYLKSPEEWMRNTEENANKISEKILYVRNTLDFVLNILIICVLTGIGEEFTFRGILQNLIGKVVRNHHVIIWIVAIIFSTVHFQFYGFVPRMLLGAYLGYLLYYTKNIWVPVLAHFTNNCFSVVYYFIFQDNPERIKAADAIGYGSTLWLSVISLALFIFIFRQIRGMRNKQDT